MNSYRILDANLNRLKEGIRVVEDIFRFNDHEELSYNLKLVRHKAILKFEYKLIKFRNSEYDVGRVSIPSEFNRENIVSLVNANFRRACESARVIEEVLKIDDNIEFGDANLFKSIRYELYSLHKKAFEADILKSFFKD